MHRSVGDIIFSWETGTKVLLNIQYIRNPKLDSEYTKDVIPLSMIMIHNIEGLTLREISHKVITKKADVEVMQLRKTVIVFVC